MNQSTFRTMKQLGLMVLVLATACGDSAQNDSKTASNAGNKALEAKQFDSAITEFTKATERYPDNHYAWYGLGAAQAKKGDWAKAADAFGRSVQIEDKQPTYQKLFGMALYEKAVASARDDQAKKLNKKPEEVEVDLSQVNFEKPMQHLQEAVKLNGDMWQAHYYLGKIFREQDKPKDAASELSAAIKANPRESGPYIALGELYRKWDYSDEAIKVTSQGVVNVPGSNEVSDIWFVLGMGYADKVMDDKAIEAFDKAIDTRKDNHKAKFERGQSYFRKGDYVHAKRDLEDFSKAGGASLELDKQQASTMLMQIAAKSAADAAPTAPPAAKQSPADLVKQSQNKKK